MPEQIFDGSKHTWRPKLVPFLQRHPRAFLSPGHTVCHHDTVRGACGCHPPSSAFSLLPGSESKWNALAPSQPAGPISPRLILEAPRQVVHSPCSPALELDARKGGRAHLLHPSPAAGAHCPSLASQHPLCASAFLSSKSSHMKPISMRLSPLTSTGMPNSAQDCRLTVQAYASSQKEAL